MRKFLNKLRYRIACMIAPNDVTVTSDSDLKNYVTKLIIGSRIKEFEKGVRLGIYTILAYMKHLNGLPAEEWCKKAYEYTERMMNNHSLSVEKKCTDDGVEVRISVPKDYEDGDGNKDLTPQD